MRRCVVCAAICSNLPQDGSVSETPTIVHVIKFAYYVRNDASFWATVCKTVRPMLSDRCLSCQSCLSATLVYCGQTVGWIRMPLGTKLGLGPGHIVLAGLPQKGTNPNFRPMSVVDDDDDDEWICTASSDALPISQTGGPSNV